MSVRIDAVSLLADVTADETLASVESILLPEGLTLGLESSESLGALSVGAWLAEGAPGGRDAWSDPADHLVAGLEVGLPDGRTLVVRPAPRRATGPDLVALVVGARNRFATLRRAWIRIHRKEAHRPCTALFDAVRDPAMTEEEERLLAGIARQLRLEES